MATASAPWRWSGCRPRIAQGTYYLTNGWIEAGDSPIAEYDSLVEQYGQEKAEWLMSRMLKNYTRWQEHSLD